MNNQSHHYILFIIELARILCADSRFLRKDKVSDKWIQVQMIQLKDEIGHAIRDITNRKNKNKITKNSRSYIAIKNNSKTNNARIQENSKKVQATARKKNKI